MQGAFGSKLKGVQQLDAVSTSASVSAVDAHLDMLRPAIASYGAKVEVRMFLLGIPEHSRRQLLHESYEYHECLMLLLQEKVPWTAMRTGS